MSKWTHVVGTIRLDDYSFISKPKRNTAKDVEKIIGPTCSFKKWNNNTKLPTGSEGSVEYKVIQNRDESSVARFTVVFWGDLRDYDDLEEIKQWFMHLREELETTDNEMMYRDAILKAWVEYTDKPLIIKLNDDTLELEEIK